MDLANSGDTSRVGELKEVIVNITANAGRPNLVEFFSVLKRWDVQGLRMRMEGNMRRIFDIFDGMLEMRKRRDRRDDLLETLLNVFQDKSQGNIDQVLIRHLLFEVFVGGTDMTTNTMEWAMTELFCNPNELLKVIVKETFRLHSPVPLILPRLSGIDKEVGGYVVPKGAQILINVGAMGRDLDVWRYNAEEFVPERFVGNDIDIKGQHFELVPFGGGWRMCPGLPLANRMLHTILGSMLNNFDWKLEDWVPSEYLNMEVS